MPNLRTLLSLLGAALGIVLVVAPFCFAISQLRNDLAIAVGAGLAVGMAVGWRSARAWAGWAIGSTVGLVAALVAGGVSGNGFLVILPPILTTTVACQIGLKAPGPRPARSDLRILLGSTLMVGLGLFFGLSGGALIGVVSAAPSVGIAAELDRRRQLRKSGSAWRPVPLIIYSTLGAIVFFGGAAFIVEQEGYQWPGALALNTAFLIVLPILIFAGTVGLTRLSQLNVSVYREFGRYARALAVPFGGFALGYSVLVLTFAGFYGSLSRLQPAAFRFDSAAVGTPMTDWLFFSFFIATSQTSIAIEPASQWAKLLVGLQILAGYGWAVVVFAIVTSYVQPLIGGSLNARRTDRD